MVLLRIQLAVALAALLFSGCKFDPAVYGLGYQECSSTAECRAGGLVCLKGLCVPDCGGAYTVAWLEPPDEKDSEYICPGGECWENPGDEFGLAYLDVALPSGTFLDLGSKKESVESCSRVVFRLSMLAPPEPQGRNLSVVIRGAKATGVVPETEGGTIGLIKFEKADDLYSRFRENTHFYVVDQEVFGWPIRLRLVPVATNTTALFWVREFEMSCCD